MPKTEIVDRYGKTVCLLDGNMQEALVYACANGVDLSRACLTGANLSGLNLSNGKFIGAFLDNCDLSGVDFSNADLTGASFGGSNLKNIKLVGAILADTELNFNDESEKEEPILTADVSETLSPLGVSEE